MLNKKKSTQSFYFPPFKERQNATTIKNHNIIDKDDTDIFDFEFTSRVSKEGPPKTFYSIQDRRFTCSSVSIQDTLMSQNSQLSYETVSSITSEIPETTKQTVAIASNDKLNLKCNSAILSTPDHQVHSYRRITLKTVPKNDIVFVNNMPYPTKLVFPSKIATNKHNNPKQYTSKHNQELIDTKRKRFQRHEGSDSYEKIIQVIDTYAY